LFNLVGYSLKVKNLTPLEDIGESALWREETKKFLKI
jgi:hypothetical protein